MPQRRSPSVHRYTTDYRLHERVRTPFIRMTGRWLEAFGFKTGVKFTAVGERHGRLVLTIVKPEAEGRQSRCDRSCARDAQDDACRRRRSDATAMRFRFYAIVGRFHPTADRMKAITHRLLLVWRTVNPIARRMSLAPRTVARHRRRLLSDRASFESERGSRECDRASLSRSRGRSRRLPRRQAE